MAGVCWMTGGRGGTWEASAIGSWLAGRHRMLPTTYLPDCLPGSVEALEREIGQIALGLPGLAEGVLPEIEAAQRHFLAGGDELFRAREADGRVAMHPGEPLRLHDLVVSPSTGVDLRRKPDEDEWFARDRVEDPASLALDLTFEGRGDLAERLLSAYAAASDDFELYRVIDYHERGCAIHRVADLAQTLGVAAAERARRWLLSGLATCHRPVLPPMLIAVGGLVASGKSTIASWLAGRLGAPRVEADRARDFLSGDDEARGLEDGFDDSVYQEMVRRAEIVLSSGRSVVLDACFPRRSQRALARRLAADRDWPFAFIECRVDSETARARIAERDARSVSGGWAQIHDDLKRRWEKVDDLSPAEHIVLDCTCPLPESESRLEALLPTEPAAHLLA